MVEMWLFVSNKGNKQWKEFAWDVKTGEIVRVFVGSRLVRVREDYGSRYLVYYRQRAVCNCRLLGSR